MDLMQFFQMMSTSNLPLVAAFFIGLMMAISPCPMATNITAIAYISRRMGGVKKTFITGLVYTLGRALIYAGIASLAVWVGISMQSIAFPLQHYGGLIIGPFLVLVGIIMLLSDRITRSIEIPYIKKFNERVAQKGLLGAFALGVIFALAFCPFSAVLFFGMLIPIVLSVGDGVLIPLVFAFGTGLPVVVVSLLLTKGIRVAESTSHRLSIFEKWVKLILSAIFIIVGAYYTAMVFIW
jgi:cytochrome c biogenesis protein CcdA